MSEVVVMNESGSIGAAHSAFGCFLQADGRKRRSTSEEEVTGIIASRAEPSRAEPSRAEPSRAEPSRAEPSRAEPSRAEPSRAEPSRAEPSRAEPSRAEPSRAEPSRAEPSRAEPSRAEPSRAEPSRAPTTRLTLPLHSGRQDVSRRPVSSSHKLGSFAACARAAVVSSTVRGAASRPRHGLPLMIPAKAPISS